MTFIAAGLSMNVSARPYPKSDHFDGEKFHNPGVNDLKSFWEFLKWKFAFDAADWPSTVKNQNYPLRPLAANEKASVTFINHATFFVQVPGLNIMTDPVYSERVSPVTFAGPKRVRRPGIALGQLPPIDVVFISHNHYDHLDLPTLKEIDSRSHPLFIVPLGLEGFLKSEGLQNVKELDWWEELKVKDVNFIFTPAQHWSGRTPFDKNLSLWGSLLLDTGKTKIYFAGDTGYSDHFKQINNKLGAPDLALLPIGAYLPRWFMKTHHLNPEEAVKAHRDLSAVKSIAMHFGTFQLTDEGINDPVKDLELARKKEGIPEKNFMILDQGQAMAY
ncbi:MAG TPA: MBL fold metallo-hydrolase [Bacteriovoracaceae bacterium]|nr:MBL fold metallo-hydrolase [Bacteriovoracaceae bacterium]